MNSRSYNDDFGTRKLGKFLNERKNWAKNRFWTTRAKRYNNLQWAQNELYLRELVKCGDFRKTDVVLDVGTGTGIVAKAVSPHVKEVIGVDKSKAMLDYIDSSGNIYFVRRDIRDPLFVANTFDRITARQVFHHILEDTQEAMNECYKILKKKGKMILSEGVPPSKRVKKDYIEIFKLKEKRLTFYEEDLRDLMVNAGFADIKTKIVRLKKMSVRNWLENSGLPRSSQEKIYTLHANAKNHFKNDYKMKITKNDCFIDMKMVILVGIKEK